MEARTEVTKAPKARGRKDSQGQSEVIRSDVVKDRLDELVRLYNVATESTDALSEAVNAAAEASGFNAAAVRAVVRAKATDTWQDKAQKAAQLALAFDECA